MLPTIITVVSLTVTSIILMPQDVASYIAQESFKSNKNLQVINMSIDAIVSRKAKEYGVSEAEMMRIIKCESSFIEDAQSLHKYKRDRPEWGVKEGDRELSYGLAQIHLPSHPNITYEQAIDPEFAIDFLAKSLSEGRGRLWSCY